MSEILEMINSTLNSDVIGGKNKEMLSENFSRLCSLLATKNKTLITPEIVKTLQEFSKDQMNLKQINARKALHNLASMDGRVFGDYLLPLSDQCYSNKEGKSIIFIQGIASSPLRTWAIP